MAVDNQRLQYILDMVDNVTGPARKVGASVKAMAEDVNKAQKSVNDLQKRASDIQGLTDMQKALAKASRRAQELSKTQANTTEALKRAKEAQKATGAELGRAEKALAKATAAGGQNAQVVARMAHQVETLRAAQAAGATQITQLTDRLKANRAESRTNTAEIGRHRTAIDAATSSLRAMGVNTDDLTREQAEAHRRMASANTELQRHQRALDAATRKQDALTKAKEQYTKAEQASQRMMAAGGKAMLAGGALMGGSVLAADPYRQFDKGMSAVQATGRMDDETKASLMAIVDKLATDSVFNHVEAAGAAGFLAQSGMNDKQIADSLGGVMSLAAATGSDLMRTADISSNILSGFQLDADQMGRVGDVLTMAANSFNVDLSMLGETMKYLAPVASKLGVSMEEATAMAGLLGNVGIQGSQAGNALKSMAGSLAAPNKKKDAILDGLGITTKDKNGDLRSMPELLKELQVKTKGMGNADMTAMFKTLFGEEFYGPAMEIVAQGGEVLDRAISDMANAKGAAAEAEAKRLDNLDGDIIKFSNQISAMQVKFGAGLDKFYRGIMQTVTAALEGVNQWMKDNPKRVAAIGLVINVLGALLGVMGAVVIGLGAMWLASAKMRLMWALLRWAALDVVKALALKLASVAMLTLGILKNVAAVGLWIAKWALLAARFVIVQTAILAFRAVIATITAAQWAWNAAMTANPIGLIIVAIAGLVAAAIWLWDNWGNLPEAFSKLWDDICGYFSAGLDWIKEMLGWDPVAAVSEVWDGLGDYFSGLFGGIWDDFMNTIGQIGNWFKEKGDWALGGFGLFGDESTAEAVKDAPKKDQATGQVKTPDTMKQGAQLAPVRQTITQTVSAPTTVTIHAPGGDMNQIRSEFQRMLDDRDAKLERQLRARQGD